MAAHRYWRVYVTAVTNVSAGSFYGGNPSVAIGEIELRESVGGPDVTGSGTATASGTINGFDAESAFDGYTSNPWESGDNDPLPQWVMYDFGVGNAKSIAEIAIWTDDYDEPLAPKDFKVQYSDDGIVWADGADITGAVMSHFTEYNYSVISGGPPASPPVITSNGGGATASISIAENTTAVTIVTATDADLDDITFSILGDDAHHFVIDPSSGVLTFKFAPDFEAPLDNNFDNDYEVTVRASDGTASDEQAITVTVTNIAPGVGSEPFLGTNWQPVVVLDSVDVSDKLVGIVSVSGEEATARIAAFDLIPDAGAISASDWLNKSVVIRYKTVNTMGQQLSSDLIFTGIVNHAVHDKSQNVVVFDCTDDMQGKLEGMTQTQIDALIINSRYSEAVFGEYKDGWQYFEKLLQTHPQSFDYNADGVTGTLVDWAAKATPDFSFDENSIFAGSINYSITPRRELLNEFTINYSYRFTRLKHREHYFNWIGTSFCGWFAQSHELATREMVLSAISGTGWKPKLPILFEGMPKAKPSVCNSTGNHVISDELADTLVLGAKFYASKRWTQQATENYTITVRAPQSVAWVGAIGFEEAYGNSTDTEATGWAEGVGTPSGRVDSHGDIVIDQVDRSVSNNDIETGIAKARTDFLSVHRENYVWADIPLEPGIERFHTVNLNSEGIEGQGKVFKFDHVMDIDSGEATTTVRIAVSLNGGAAAGGDAVITPPSAPSSDPSGAGPSDTTVLPTRIGNDDTVPNFDDDWNGFTGNYSVAVGSPSPEQIYSRRFKVQTPAIEQDAIDHVEGNASQTYEFDIPNETLTITV